MNQPRVTWSMMGNLSDTITRISRTVVTTLPLVGELAVTAGLLVQSSVAFNLSRDFCIFFLERKRRDNSLLRAFGRASDFRRNVSYVCFLKNISLLASS